jgi:hypothetical protein
MPTQLMQSDIMYRKVDQIIELMKQADLDGETMEYIIRQVDMQEQMLRQLVMTADQMEVQQLLEERMELMKQHSPIKRGSDESSVGTSFHGHVVQATIGELKAIFGEPDFQGDDFADNKLTHEWIFETAEGNVFTLYDWKEYRKIPEYEVIEWHIGAKSGYAGMLARDEVQSALDHYHKRSRN